MVRFSTTFFGKQKQQKIKMKVRHEWFVRISENEMLLFMGYMTERDNIISLTDRVLTGELKMFKLDI